MLREQDLSIDELMNYGINYCDGMPININDLRKLYDSKEAKRVFDTSIDLLRKELIEDYKLPEAIVNSYIDSGYIMVLESSSIKKELYFDYHNLMRIALCYFMNEDLRGEIIDIIQGKNICELKTAVNAKLKEIRSEFSNCKDNQSKLEFYENHPAVSNIVAAEAQKEGIEEISEVDRRISQQMTDLIVNNKYLADFFETSVFDISLLEEINKEKFTFYLALVTLDGCMYDEEIDNSVYYAINYYLNKVETGIPNITVNYNNKLYSFANFANQLQEYLEKHPNIRMKKFKANLFSDCNPEEVNSYLEEFHNETLNNFDVVDTDDVYLPYGKDTYTSSKGSKTPRIKKEKKQDEISLLTLQKRKFFNENKEQIYKSLMGKNKFDGYIAHVLKNGYVIFEKYDSNDNMLSNKPGAAYIMTINNFNEFSRRTITEIRDYVKQNPDGDISYQCHKGKWMERLQEKVNETTGISLSQIDRVLMKSAD